jgi:hypothetical protein
MELSESRYNGWTNYETWNAKLWMDNDEGSYKDSRAMAREALEDAEQDEDEAAIKLSNTIKDWFLEAMPELPASFWSDILNAAFHEVDWREIADSLIEEVRDES